MKTIINSSHNTLTLQDVKERKSGGAFFLANYIKNHNLVSEAGIVVSGVDCPNSEDKDHTFVRFRIWDNHFSFALLRGLFALGGKPEGLSVFINKHSRDFFIKFNDGNLPKAEQYLTMIFERLNQEIDYRVYLTRKLKLEYEFEEELRTLKK